MRQKTKIKNKLMFLLTKCLLLLLFAMKKRGQKEKEGKPVTLSLSNNVYRANHRNNYSKETNLKYSLKHFWQFIFIFFFLVIIIIVIINIVIIFENQIVPKTLQN